MLPKPKECKDCIAYGDGRGFVPDRISPQTSVIVYAQNPGEDEERGQRYLGQNQWESHPPEPLIGKTGRLLDRTFLPLAGLNREEVGLANSLRCRWNYQNTLPGLKDKALQQALLYCTRAHWKPPEHAKLYIAMGEVATYALTQQAHDFNGWRGYLLPYQSLGTPRMPQDRIWTPWQYPGSPPPVLVTHHLAYLFRVPEAELPAKRDWNKVAQILAGQWPVSMSPITRQAPDLWPSYAAFDTEFAEDHHDRLTRYSLATRDRRVWVVEASQARPMPVVPPTTVVMHNAPADLPHLHGLIDMGGVEIEDTMYAHAVLWTGKVETDEQRGKTGGAMSHTLNFLGSLYARINRWKHLAKVAPVTYSGGDALGTMDVWDTGLHGGLKGELARDPQSQWVYQNLQKPLVPLVFRAMQRGIATDQAAVAVALRDIKRDQARLVMQAHAYCGWPINLRSPKQLAFWLYIIERRLKI